MPRPRSTDESRFRLRRFITRFCPWSATPIWARFPRPGLPLPQNRFRHPEDAREQLQRGLDLHQQVFGIRPQGVWPSEGSVSEEVFTIAQSLGVKWMATDEDVLGRSLGISFARDGHGHLPGELAAKLYTIHRFENDQTEMNLIFRDHTISDLIGFVYSGMPPQDAANHLMHNIKQAAQPVLDAGHDAVVPIILDGENAWEYYPQSGREFLRRFYDALQREPGVEAVTVSEAIARHQQFRQADVAGSRLLDSRQLQRLDRRPEDNRSWDYLYHARNFYAQAAPAASEAQRQLAFEEILIAEGSDWNWWYGPEHHSANDREFDELYRKHLSNVYQALGAGRPTIWRSPFSAARCGRRFFRRPLTFIPGSPATWCATSSGWVPPSTPPTAAPAPCMASSSCSTRFTPELTKPTSTDAWILPRTQSRKRISTWWSIWNPGRRTDQRPRRALRLDVGVESGKIRTWKVSVPDADQPLASFDRPTDQVAVALVRNFEFKLPLDWLLAVPVASTE